MANPADCRFSDSHEWFHVDGDVITIGITKYAADELTDITYVEMKGVGDAIGAGDSVGEVESVKTTADVYSVAGGEIIEHNDALADDPSLVNSDPMGAGWLVKLRTGDASPLEGLMDHAAYGAKYTAE